MPYRIFIVEDHPAMREAYARAIGREADCELCGIAGSGEEALAVLDGIRCDLVVTDVLLPGMDGIEMTERLRGMRPDLAVLVISTFEEDVFVRRALAAGARAFLSKRELDGKLVETIRQVLRGNPGEGLADGDDEPDAPGV